MSKILDKIKTFFKSNIEIIMPTAVLATICIVVTLALSSTNMLTENKIAALAEQTQNEAMSKLIEADEYTIQTASLSSGEIDYNIAVKDGETIGYIFVVDTKGYGGTVSVMTAVNTNGAIAAVEILDASNETPGLGQNVTKQDFFTQFTNLTDNITVIKGGTASADNNEINAVTGATISSKAVTKAVNEALSYASEIIAKGDIS